ncbi:MULTISPECIES: hydrogenase formation protein HypD [unclassified Novosphingobium]|uniref:hydrogenase formation protein HypD n=1 Tax=unclassified Novosphingobium TaxID=2644732 RepID=UPI00086A6F07|nr:MULTISPECIES: hydrogenase formation protein HypD [unclassified Novosphingobium]MBN9143606.1 hydrogenase formation protein HypD [Novosphingobium sp.]ODU83644.1 MAG: hydrogenase formation protein HypD [Novosphingobium sp. SCN 63-17]OJX92773.1 MAG: hydrogenase formation protein HypD [Novosphingobium sp. 63-713]
MKYVSEFRDPALAQSLAKAIAREADPARSYAFMEFCGGHTHAIFRYGVQDLVPSNVRFVHGPGCPVCVLPMRRLDDALELAERHGVILATYGDMMRVPGSGRRSMLTARSAGADIRMVYSPLDALALARDNPDRQVVFMGIGFETTTPATGMAILTARAQGLANFSVFCNHVLTPPAMAHVLAAPGVALDGFLGPSHVSTVIGAGAYRPLVAHYGRPMVIAGFEPLDVLQSVLMLIRQVNEGRQEVENQYSRVVTEAGNTKAQGVIEEVFALRDTFEWRGLGSVPDSARAIRPELADFDAEARFAISEKQSREVKSCECPAILRGVKQPKDCKLFGKACTPETPMGACMVSSEGSCAAYYTYRRAETMAEMEAAE